MKAGAARTEAEAIEADDTTLAKLARTTGLGARSSLGAWFEENAAAFGEVLARAEGERWQRYAHVFAKDRLLMVPLAFWERGAEGDLARRRAAATVKRAWLRTRARLGTAFSQPPTPALTPSEAPAATPAAASVLGRLEDPAEDAPAEETPAAPRFGVSRPRGFDTD